MHWACKYIGKTPEQVGHCWGLVRSVYLEDFGISLPIYPGFDQLTLAALAALIRKEAEHDWIEVQTPFEGCVVAMSQKNGEDLHHVGIYTFADRGKVVHCWKTNNTIADTFTGLRVKGFRVIRFYRHRLWPTS